MGRKKPTELGCRAWYKRKTAKKERHKEKLFGQKYDPNTDPAPPSLVRKHHSWDLS